jgi:hypothetical protein
MTFIGETKNGAVVETWSNPFYTVRCACGAPFKANREKIKAVLRNPKLFLRCNACYRAGQSRKAYREMGREPA